MASKTIEDLWAKACPDEDPELMAAVGMMSHVGEAYKAGRIDNHEGRKLQDYLDQRNLVDLRDQTQNDDD